MVLQPRSECLLKHKQMKGSRSLGLCTSLYRLLTTRMNTTGKRAQILWNYFLDAPVCGEFVRRFVPQFPACWLEAPGSLFDNLDIKKTATRDIVVKPTAYGSQTGRLHQQVNIGLGVLHIHPAIAIHRFHLSFGGGGGGCCCGGGGCCCCCSNCRSFLQASLRSAVVLDDFRNKCNLVILCFSQNVYIFVAITSSAPSELCEQCSLFYYCRCHRREYFGFPSPLMFSFFNEGCFPCKNRPENEWESVWKRKRVRGRFKYHNNYLKKTDFLSTQLKSLQYGQIGTRQPKYHSVDLLLMSGVNYRGRSFSVSFHFLPSSLVSPLCFSIPPPVLLCPFLLLSFHFFLFLFLCSFLLFSLFTFFLSPFLSPSPNSSLTFPPSFKSSVLTCAL